MNAPRILIVDDLFGASLRDRHSLCKAYRLRDVTGDDPAPVAIDGIPLARAVFSSAQERLPGRVVNAVARVLRDVAAGWPGPDGERWALCLLDLRFVSGPLGADGVAAGEDGDDEFGLHILMALRRAYPHLPVVIMSSRERSEVIQQCRQMGAVDFIQRHVDSGPAHEVLAKKLHDFGLVPDPRGIIVGQSVVLLQALACARRAATGAGNVLLLGETGTGKELFARYIHDNSPLAGGPYKVFDAFGTAEALQEDLLFGHETGAYTGARQARRGLFEEARGGTLFIDELGDISGAVQNRLLRPIEARTIARQGSSVEVAVSFQLVLATNKDLGASARQGRFKNDLLNRVNAYTIWLPPLRERPGDIPLLAGVMLERLCRAHALRWPRVIAPDAMQRLVAHDWREGNVRELRSMLERAAKDNRDAELLILSDLDLAQRAMMASSALVDCAGGEAVVGDYDHLFGSWPQLQRQTAVTLLSSLHGALHATARRNPADGAMRPNLAGAAGCLLGRKVSSVEAADFVKRIVRFDPSMAHQYGEQRPLLAEAVDQALRTRAGTESKAAPRSRVRS
jgi:DNA-binding NtrC family response regulator